MNVTIDKATSADIDELVAIQKKAFERLYNIYHDDTSPYLRGAEEFERWFDCGHGVYKIFADSVLAGDLTVFRSRTDAQEYYLARVYVAPELQQRSIALFAMLRC